MRLLRLAPALLAAALLILSRPAAAQSGFGICNGFCRYLLNAGGLAAVRPHRFEEFPDVWFEDASPVRPLRKHRTAKTPGSHPHHASKQRTAKETLRRTNNTRRMARITPSAKPKFYPIESSAASAQRSSVVSRKESNSDPLPVGKQGSSEAVKEEAKSDVVIEASPQSDVTSTPPPVSKTQEDATSGTAKDSATQAAAVGISSETSPVEKREDRAMEVDETSTVADPALPAVASRKEARLNTEQEIYSDQAAKVIPLLRATDVSDTEPHPIPSEVLKIEPLLHDFLYVKKANGDIGLVSALTHEEVGVLRSRPDTTPR